MRWHDLILAHSTPILKKNERSFFDMPKVSSNHLESRRNEILDAAWRCFGRQGFHQTTMRDICREAGLSPGAVYQYFQGKDAIIQAVAEVGRREGAARVVPVEEAEHPPRALAESLERFLDCLDDPEALPSIRIDIRLCAEALHEMQVRGVVLENYERLLDLFAQLVRQGQELGLIDAVLPRAWPAS
jgi:AcrR family transcriptional regulator